MPVMLAFAIGNLSKCTYKADQTGAPAVWMGGAKGEWEGSAKRKLSEVLNSEAHVEASCHP